VEPWTAAVFGLPRQRCSVALESLLADRLGEECNCRRQGKQARIVVFIDATTGAFGKELDESEKVEGVQTDRSAARATVPWTVFITSSPMWTYHLRQGGVHAL
jgi:hypothetical protein